MKSQSQPNKARPRTAAEEAFTARAARAAQNQRHRDLEENKAAAIALLRNGEELARFVPPDS